MVSGMEQTVGDYSIAVPIKNFQFNGVVRVRLCIGNYVAYAYRLASGQRDKRIAGQTISHGSWRIVAR